MITLTTPITIPNATRVEVADANFDEDNGVALVRIRARPTGPGTPSRVFQIQLQDSPKLSEKVVRGSSPGGIDDAIAMVPAVAIASAFTNLRNAWYSAANTPNARRRAAETQGLADGWIDASLAGGVA